ncbi:hypothetical protein YTPLAS18_08890 [Nitrospira sp.]|nr:hypothetical protein YTPLAS18_08890 [Nitrospira sp.]
MIRAIVLSLALTGGLLIAHGCGPTKVTTQTSPYVSRYPIRSLAVLPFETLDTPQSLGDETDSFHVPESVKKSDIAITIPSNVEMREQRTATVQPNAGETVTRLIWNRLGARAGLTVRPLDESLVALHQVAGQAGSERKGLVAAEVGKKLGVDGVVIGKVLVYKERVGSRIGAESAAVGYEVRLFGLDGELLWEGNYYEKQRPMIEDMWGFLERKGAFVTAAELASYGADKMLKDFPYGRTE